MGYSLYWLRGGLGAACYADCEPARVGDPFLVIPDAARPSVSNDGTLVVRRGRDSHRDIVWVDRTGLVREPVVTGEQDAVMPRMSPDGSRVAYVINDGTQRVWTLDPARGTRRSIEPDEGPQFDPVWSNDGRRVYYATFDPREPDDEEAFIRVQDVISGDTRTVAERAYYPTVSGDGRTIAFVVGPTDDTDVMHVSLDRPQDPPQAFLDGPAVDHNPSFSPTDDVMAYLHTDGGFMSFEVYVSRFPGGEERTLVSRGDVEWPTLLRWSRDGKKLYYASATDGGLMEVDVSVGAEMSVSEPRRLFGEMDSDLQLAQGFDVNEDGTRFLVVRDVPRAGSDPAGLIVIQNWLASVAAGRESR